MEHLARGYRTHWPRPWWMGHHTWQHTPRECVAHLWIGRTHARCTATAASSARRGTRRSVSFAYTLSVRKASTVPPTRRDTKRRLRDGGWAITPSRRLSISTGG